MPGVFQRKREGLYEKETGGAGAGAAQSIPPGAAPISNYPRRRARVLWRTEFESVQAEKVPLKFFEHVDFIEDFCPVLVFGVQREPYGRAEEDADFLRKSEARLRNKDGGSSASCGSSFSCGRREQPEDSPGARQE
jgi:hypothetical protein